MWAPNFSTRFLLLMTGALAVLAWIGSWAARDAIWAQTLVIVFCAACVLFLQLAVLFVIAICLSGGVRKLLREAQQIEHFDQSPSPFAEHLAPPPPTPEELT